MVAQLLFSNNPLASVKPAMSYEGGNTPVPVMWQLLFHMYSTLVCTNTHYNTNQCMLGFLWTMFLSNASTNALS